MKNKVLIVDDDPIAASLISSALQENGYNVIACSDSYSALVVFRKETIDVALVELVLPEITGKELIQKGTRLQHDCKFIVVSSLLGMDDFISLQTMGVYDSFHKPADIQIIIKAVAMAHGGQRRKELVSEVW